MTAREGTLTYLATAAFLAALFGVWSRAAHGAESALGREQLAAAVQKALWRDGLVPESTRVRAVQSATRLSAAEGEGLAVELPVDATAAGGARAGRTPAVLVTAARRVPVVLELEARGAVLVATRDLPARSVLGPGDVRVQEDFDLGEAPRDAVAALDDVAGQRLLAPVRAGAAVRRSALERVAVVRRGDAVTILVRVGAVRASAPGEVQGSGAPGDRVRVVNTTSGRTLEARVVDAATVEVR